jgi:16S rRNA G966 N2-methylase RsmD
VLRDLPLVQKLLDHVNSSATRLLQSRDVRDIAQNLATRNLPLAGRLKNFLTNWHCITQDEWVLNTVSGYRIVFLRKPYQHRKPPQLAFAEKEEECMQAEIQSMLEKQAISLVEERSESFYSQMFLVPKKDSRQRPVINLKN